MMTEKELSVIESKKKLSIIVEAWVKLKEKLWKQVEKACYVGVAFIWILILPVFTPEFADINPEFTSPTC